MSDLIRYVPVLCWKRAEMAALKHLRPVDKGAITPLLEIPPTDSTSTANVNDLLARAVDQIATNWGRASVFVELGLLPEFSRKSDTHPVVVLWKVARQHKLSLVPVTGLN